MRYPLKKNNILGLGGLLASNVENQSNWVILSDGHPSRSQHIQWLMLSTANSPAGLMSSQLLRQPCFHLTQEHLGYLVSHHLSHPSSEWNTK